MTRTIDASTPKHIMHTCRAIRGTWSEHERQQRQRLAERKQQVIVNLVASKAACDVRQVA
jgi:hypothetical protein